MWHVFGSVCLFDFFLLSFSFSLVNCVYMFVACCFIHIFCFFLNFIQLQFFVTHSIMMTISRFNICYGALIRSTRKIMEFLLFRLSVFQLVIFWHIFFSFSVECVLPTITSTLLPRIWFWLFYWLQYSLIFWNCVHTYILHTHNYMPNLDIVGINFDSTAIKSECIGITLSNRTIGKLGGSQRILCYCFWYIYRYSTRHSSTISAIYCILHIYLIM